jgi:hypothetical protein
MRPTLAQIVQMATNSSPEAYQEWCDTIRELEGSEYRGYRYRGYHVVKLEDFCWPDDEACLHKGSVVAFQESGAHIERYFIHAVNRRTRKAWATVQTMDDRAAPDTFAYLPLKTAAAVHKTFNLVWHQVRDTEIAEHNIAVDVWLDKARTLSPDAYLDWCDGQHPDWFEYQGLYAGDIGRGHTHMPVTEARHVDTWKHVVDIIAVDRVGKGLYGAYRKSDAEPPLLPPETAAAVVAAAVAAQQDDVEPRKKYLEERRAVKEAWEVQRAAAILCGTP